MYGNMQANYGAYGMQPPQQYIMPPQQQPAPFQQTVAPTGNPERQGDYGAQPVRAHENPPAQRRPAPAHETRSAINATAPKYAAPVVQHTAADQTKAVGLGKLLGVAIGGRQPSATRGKLPFGSLW